MAINKKAVLDDLATIDAALDTLQATHFPASGATEHMKYVGYRMTVERIKGTVDMLRQSITGPTAPV